VLFCRGGSRAALFPSHRICRGGSRAALVSSDRICRGGSRAALVPLDRTRKGRFVNRPYVIGMGYVGAVLAPPLLGREAISGNGQTQGLPLRDAHVFRWHFLIKTRQASRPARKLLTLDCACGYATFMTESVGGLSCAHKAKERRRLTNPA